MSTPLDAQIIETIARWGVTAWLVGGYVRDLLVGRASRDLDMVVPAGAIRLARRLAAALGGAAFALDEARDVGRVVLKAGSGETVEVDIARLRAPDLVDDLALRDFTVNAIAMEIVPASAVPRLYDPFDGRADINRRLIRAVTDGAFRDDPLRVLRAVRLAVELGYRIEEGTAGLIRRDAELLAIVSSERVRDELARIVEAPGAWQHLRLLRRLHLLPHALPESAAQMGVLQSEPHYQDVFDHSRSVMVHLEGLCAAFRTGEQQPPPAAVAGDDTVIASPERWSAVQAVLAPYAGALAAHLALPLAADRTRLDLMPWAALAHDWGKPACRSTAESGRVHFIGHDRWGALLAEARLQALRFSADEVSYVARLVGLHMRPGLLAQEETLSRRAVYRFFRDAGSVGPDCVLLSLADHLATRAASPLDEARLRRRLEVASRLLQAYFLEREKVVSPAPLLDGNQVMAELGLRPGPEVGAALEALREVQAAGEVGTAEQARAWLLAWSGHAAR